MTDDRQQRVLDGRDEFLRVAEELGENGGVTADAILSAGLFVLLSVLDDLDLAAERLRHIAAGVDRAQTIDPPIQGGRMQ